MFSEAARRAGTAGGFFLPRSGRFGFWPFDGGTLELLGVFAGTASLASSSPMRAVSAGLPVHHSNMVAAHDPNEQKPLMP